MVEQIVHELSLQKDYLQGEPLETIYLGGGTPSLLTAKELDIIFSAIYKNYQVLGKPEITLEANPDDLTTKKLHKLQAAGINRLSIGIQSFDDSVLRFLNRAHTAAEAWHCLDLAHEAGISNCSIDLIYSIPGQNNELLNNNLATALKLKPAHISAYSLTLEEKTVFGRWTSHGKLAAMDETTSAFQFEMVMDTLVQHGYSHYEISNFCLSGFESKHNTSYWQQKKYLGIGPSAHSFDTASRQFNISNNALYIKALREDRIPFEREILTLENKINEYIFTSLRTNRGCSLPYLVSTFGYDLKKKNELYLDKLLKEKMIELTPDVLILTRTGKLVADRIASDLFML